MLLSFSLIFLVGMALATLAEKCKLPRLVGMLLAGVMLGPQVLHWLDSQTLSISGDLRKMALVLILLKAGLTLRLSELKRVGKGAIGLSFLPATFEMIAVTFLAQWLLGIPLWQSALLGAILSAVSPAVVVPHMTRLIDEKRGTKKCIPQMLLAGASMDDVYVIVIFSALLSLAQGGTVNALQFLDIPLSILIGLGTGASVGVGLSYFFQKFAMRDSLKGLLLLGLGFLLVGLEDILPFPFSGLLSVISMGIGLGQKNAPIAKRLSEKCAKLWVGAELILFVLVGAALQIHSAWEAGVASIAVILLALCVRSIGTWLAISTEKLTPKEKLFCLVAYLPKATVQAAIGSVPLSVGLSSGQTILAVAVMAILITAPLGAFLIDKLAPICLHKD